MDGSFGQSNKTFLLLKTLSEQQNSILRISHVDQHNNYTTEISLVKVKVKVYAKNKTARFLSENKGGFSCTIFTYELARVSYAHRKGEQQDLFFM